MRVAFQSVMSRLLLLSLAGACVPAQSYEARIPMTLGTANTYYVQGRFGDLNDMPFMVDTGSGYLSINPTTLETLLRNGLAAYQEELPGRLADGSEIEVPVYRVTRFNIGPCLLQDVEAVVFPYTERQIIGLNVLARSAPFTFSVDPPELVLSHCDNDDFARTGKSPQAHAEPDRHAIPALAGVNPDARSRSGN